MGTELLASGVCKVIKMPEDSALLECFYLGDLYLYKKKKGPLTFFKWDRKKAEYQKYTENVTYFEIENKDKPNKSLNLRARAFSEFFEKIS